MLSASDLVTIMMTTVGCTALVALAAAVALRVLRGTSMTARFAIVVCTVVVAILASTVAIAELMMVSPHDLEVLLWVVSIASALSLAAAWLVGRSVRSSMRRLLDTARLVGDGDVVRMGATGIREVDEVASQLADASERLADARAELERLDATRQQLFAWISHDLRTPLAGIRALAESLDEGDVDDHAAYVRRLRAQADSMSRLVDDLFELSRLHSGSVRLRCATVELLDVVSDAVVDVQPLASARGIRIAHAGVAGHTVWADAHELTRAIVNLLANAIKHAPTCSEIVVSAHRGDDDHLVLGVLDQGSGVDAADLGRMFEVGWQASASRSAADSETSGGAGLGLAIVRGIVEAHGGSVHAHHVDGGFELRVSLPTERAPESVDSGATP